MRKFILLACLLLGCVGGCSPDRRAAQEALTKLEPTRREASLLHLLQVNPNTTNGQARLRKMRRDREQLDKILKERRDRKKKATAKR